VHLVALFAVLLCAADAHESARADTGHSPLRATGGAIDCGIARNFAWQASLALRRGEPAEAFLERQGWIDSPSPAARGIVRYVYEFRTNRIASVAAITNLAVGHCESKVFGRVDCGAFPKPFIEALGGCDDARVFGGAFRGTSGGTRRPGAGAPPELGAARPHDASAVPTGAPRRPTTRPASHLAERHADPVARCRARLTRAIDRLNPRAGETLTERRRNTLRERRWQLANALGDC